MPLVNNLPSNSYMSQQFAKSSGYVNTSGSHNAVHTGGNGGGVHGAFDNVSQIMPSAAYQLELTMQ